MHVSRALGGVTILQKGPQDIICTNTGGTSDADARASKVDASENTEEQVSVEIAGGLKRCGGQGDILSGTVGTALAWGKCFEDGAFGCVTASGPRPVYSHVVRVPSYISCRDRSIPSSRIPLLAAIAGSMVTRTASRRAFSKQGRGKRLDVFPSTQTCLALSSVCL